MSETTGRISTDKDNELRRVVPGQRTTGISWKWNALFRTKKLTPGTQRISSVSLATPGTQRISSVSPAVKPLQYKKRPRSKIPRPAVLVGIACTIVMLVIVAVSSSSGDACDPTANTCGPMAICDSATLKCIECPPTQVSSGHNKCLSADMCASVELLGSHKISGSSGGLKMKLNGGTWFGRAVASVGDLNGDGMVDLAVGAPRQEEDTVVKNYGAVDILFLNPDYSVKSEKKIGVGNLNTMTGGLVGPLEKQDGFGYALDSIGDLDGDGVEDLVVGALDDDDGGGNRGALYVLFLNTTGDVKKEQKISSTKGGLTIPLETGDRFGVGVVRVGDVDQDGVVDVAVAKSKQGGNDAKIDIYILFLKIDGTVKDSQWVRNTVGRPKLFSMAGIGDLDRDGVLDLAVGSPGDNLGGTYRGAAYILFMNKDGTVKSAQKIGAENGRLGELRANGYFGAVAIIGDLDGDGITDLAVGAGGTGTVSPDDLGGAVHVLLLNRDGTVKGRQAISSTDGWLMGELDSGDSFGCSVATLGMHQGGGGDKMIRLVVGACDDDDHAKDAGAVYILEVRGRNLC